MKNKIIFIALILGIFCCSISAINANDTDIVLNHSDEISISDYSNVYSFNNADINNEVQSGADEENIIPIENEVNVTKKPTHIDASNVELYYKNGTRFEAYLYDEDNNPLAGQTVTISINGVSYDKITNEKGKVSIGINLSPNKYLVNVNFKGTELYSQSNCTSSVTVLSTIKSENLTKYYRNQSQYYAQFLDNNGNPLVKGKVSFNIHGVFYYRTTDANGMAKLNINLDPGEYIITAIHSNNGFLYSSIIKVLSTIEGMDLIKAFHDNHQYYAKFLDSTGNPLVGGKVYFNINGVIYNRITNASGMAKLNINLAPGKYILTAHNGNDGLLASNNITILIDVDTKLQVEDMTFEEDSKQTIPVTLFDELGYTLPDKTVSLLIYNKWYEAKTDKNGVAYFNINLSPGSYAAVYHFNGTDVYAPSVKETTITVNKGKNVIYEVNDTILNQGEKFSLVVKDINGKPLKDTKIIFTINGVRYDRYTDNNGIASIEINLNPNHYLIEYEVDRAGYDKSKNSTNITLISTDITDLSTTTTEVYAGESQKFDIILKAGTVTIPNQKITLIINNISYTRTTNSEGIAYITINLAPGKYSIYVSFNGTNKLKSTNKIFDLTVSNLIATKFTVTSGFDILHGNEFSVKLSDNNNIGLANKNVIINVNGEKYTVTTNGDGVAAIKINLPNGNYPVTCEFETEYPYKSCKLSTEIHVFENNVNGNGYWLFGRDMLKADLPSLASQGTGNIFLNFAAFSTHGQEKVVQWIKQANNYGIKVHIWMQAFYDGKFLSPVLADGSPNVELLDKKIDEAKYYAGIKGVSGIHLDYLRFPGTAYKYPTGTETINNFVKALSEEVRAINPNIILSVAVMPETTSDIYYYGQDVNTLGKYVDIIIPMVYKGNYGSGTSWITTTTKWFVDNSNGAQVWTGLQGYKSDNDVVKLPVSELTGDAQAAINGGAIGTIIFRWGVTNFINFSSLNHPSEPDVPEGTKFTASEIKLAAKEIKAYMEANGVLPSSITIGTSKCSASQALYLMSEFIANYNNQFDFALIEVSEPVNPSTNSIRGYLDKGNYTAIAKSIVDYITTHKSAPEFMSSQIGDIPYSALVYAYSKIISYLDNNGKLPLTVYVTNIVEDYSIEVTMKPSVNSEYKYIYYKSTWLSFCPKCGFYGTLLDNPKHVAEGELTCSKCDADFCGVTGKEKISGSNVYLTRLAGPIPVEPVPSNSSISINDIMAASLYVKGYYEANGEIPEIIYISDGEFSDAQYLYLVSKAIYNINLGNFSDIKMINVTKAPNPSGDIVHSQLDKEEYLDVVQRVVEFIEKEGQAPNYASSVIGKIIYEELVDSFSRILAFYNNTGKLPNLVSISYGDSNSKNISDLSKALIEGLNTTKQKATALFNYVRDSITYIFYENTVRGAEGTLITGGGNCCDQAQLLVAMARSVNLTVRFEHGRCRFSSGTWYGHVWVQFLINGEWVTADPTSTRNSLGVIKNWNTDTYIHKGYYDILPF